MGTRATIAAIAVTGLLMASDLAIGDASWANQPYQLTIPAQIAGRGQSVSSSINLTLNHDVACTVDISAVSGNEVLHNGAATLTTQYKLRGACLSVQDGDWISAADFISSSGYVVPGTGPTDTVTLHVQATAPTASDPPAGDYSATLTVTVSWP